MRESDWDMLQRIVDEQAEDAILWSQPGTVVGVALQRALRRLHTAIEGKTPTECALEAIGEKISG